MGQQRTGKERKDISMFRQCRGRTLGTWNHRASAAEPGGVAEAGSREGGTQLTPELRRLRSDPVHPEAIRVWAVRCQSLSSQLVCSVPPHWGLEMSQGGSVYTSGTANITNQVPFLSDFKILVSGGLGSWRIFILLVLLIRLSIR